VIEVAEHVPEPPQLELAPTSAVQRHAQGEQRRQPLRLVTGTASRINGCGVVFRSATATMAAASFPGPASTGQLSTTARSSRVTGVSLRRRTTSGVTLRCTTRMRSGPADAQREAWSHERLPPLCPEPANPSGATPTRGSGPLPPRIQQCRSFSGPHVVHVISADIRRSGAVASPRWCGLRARGRGRGRRRAPTAAAPRDHWPRTPRSTNGSRLDGPARRPRAKVVVVICGRRAFASSPVERGVAHFPQSRC
jgi:hypothetical protein